MELNSLFESTESSGVIGCYGLEKSRDVPMDWVHVVEVFFQRFNLLYLVALEVVDVDARTAVLKQMGRRVSRYLGLGGGVSRPQKPN